MKVKTSELTGVALDWAVAQIEQVGGKYDRIWKQITVGDPQNAVHRSFWSPSQNWKIGGPVIDREGISTNRQFDKQWIAHKADSAHRYSTPANTQYGPTPLVAAMRCYVASKLGDEIDIPEELK